MPAIKVDTLLDAIGSSPATNSTAASTSRFLLQGLRLPYPSMTSATYPLYSLSAQAFPLSSPLPAISLSITNPVAWIKFAGGGSSLQVQFTTDEQAMITAFQSLTFEPQVSWIGQLPLFTYQPTHFTVQNPLHWQAAAPPAVACLNNNGQVVNEPTVWALPLTLINQIADATGPALFYDLAVSTYVDATSGLQTNPVSCYAWATTVDIKVQQITASSSDATQMPNTYLLIGADDVGNQTLFDLINYLNTAAGKNDSATLYLLYKPDPSSPNPQGLASDQLNATNTFLLKTNLSTLSNSGVVLPRAAMREPSDAYTGRGELQANVQTFIATIGQATDFLTLVWEAGVVKSGGFYLQYMNSDQAGLPGYLFTQSIEATLTLTILLKSQTQSSDANLWPFNNVVVVGDNIDSSQSNVFAEPTTYKVQPGDTLQTIANKLTSFGMDVPTLALANQTIQNLLKQGQSLNLAPSTPYIINYGDTFASIAQAHPSTSVTGIANASAGLGIFTPGALMQLTGLQTYILQPGDTLIDIVQHLNVPGLDVPAFARANQNNLELLQPGKTLNLSSTATYTIQAGDTLASIALANPPASVEGIAIASQQLAILKPTELAFYGTQQLEMHATAPPGNTGFQLWRSNVTTDPNQQQLNLMFNLLGYSIAQNAFFNASNEGLPAGPQKEPGTQSSNETNELSLDEDDGTLYYKQVLAVYKSANPTYNAVPDTPALPAPSGFPYAGIFSDPARANHRLCSSISIFTISQAT